MNKNLCPVCGGKRVKNGRNRNGKQRWKCVECSSSAINRIDRRTHELRMFLSWLFGKNSQEEYGDFTGRTFRNHTKWVWDYWLLPPIVEETHDVVFLDGIYLSRNCVVVIAMTREYVLGWYVARSENVNAWRALLSRIAPPRMVVIDGGTGLKTALKQCWKNTFVQRCRFHAFGQVKRYTTSRPRTQAGADLYGLTKGLFSIETHDGAVLWIQDFFHWKTLYHDFLEERNTEGDYLHERLRKARASLDRLIREGTLFTFIDTDLRTQLSLADDESLPATTNAIESLNSRLRAMLRHHKGLPIDRRIKALYWFCYLHSPAPVPLKDIPSIMPTDTDIEHAYQRLGSRQKTHETIPRWGTAIVWEDLHHQTPYNTWN